MFNKNNLCVFLLCSFLIISIFSVSATDTYYDLKSTQTTPHIYEGNYLTGIDFPIGALGGGTIRMNGKAERTWWQIFNNFEEKEGSGIVPNSFFAIRTNTNGTIVVKALQTAPVAKFLAMNSLKFSGEFPFGWYNFNDNELPVEVKLEAFNPLIPMDLKNSAIPCAIFKITVKNTSANTSDISILGSQQNAVGFDGYGTIYSGRKFAGYGSNINTIVSDASSTSLKMTGTNGSMQLTAYETGMSSTASWDNLTTLYNDFSSDGILTGTASASSPLIKTTVDGALAKNFTLAPGEEKTITFVLSWYFPNGTSGRADIAQWYFPNGGSQYQNWWTDANDVDTYVKTNFNMLDTKTRLYHQTLYASNIPRYVIDRINSNLCVLKSPTAFWTKNGYFGVWESTSSQQAWFGNCKHVYQYAQGISWIFPELSRKIMVQNLNSQLSDGLLPARDGEPGNALDGHLGTILGIYRDYLLTDDNVWLNTVWAKTKKAMDYVITNYDADKNGTFEGAYANTLDGSTSGTNPVIAGMYVGALRATAKMAERKNDISSRDLYNSIAITAKTNISTLLWDNNLKYFVEKSQNLPNSSSFGNGSYISMFDGQWWSNMLDLGQIYPLDKTIVSLSQIYNRNKVTDIDGQYSTGYRDFLGNGDTGWIMSKFQGALPSNPVHYHSEVMSGFEYAFAAAMLQYGMINEGLDVVNNIAKRYDGRFRAAGVEVQTGNNATVFGTGSPFGEDECGDFYGRALSSWSVLTSLQGFNYDGPNKTIKFIPKWKSDNHISFFSSSTGYGILSQTQSATNQVSKIEVKSGVTKIKTIVLAVPTSKVAQNVVGKMDGNVLETLSVEQLGNTLTLILTNTSDVNANSDITVSFDLGVGITINNNANLSDLKVSGTSIADFSSEKIVYTVLMPLGSTTVPLVTATLSDIGNATISFAQATSIPGSANITVTAQDGITIKNYIVNFIYEKEQIIQLQSFNYTFDNGGIVGWTVLSGTWTNTATSLQGNWGGVNGLILKNSIVGNNFVYEADIKISTAGAAGVLTFRGSKDGSNCYLVALDAGSSVIKLYKFPYQSLITVPYTFNTNVFYHLKVVALNNNIKVYFNNNSTPSIDFNDTSYASGWFGLNIWAGSAVFDNVKAENLANNPSGIDENKVSINEWFFDDNTMIFKSLPTSNIEIYSIAGTKLHEYIPNYKIKINLQKGLYIVKFDNKTAKIILS